MIKLVVLYGHPTDPAEFDRYYHQTHVPLAQKIPDLKRFEAGRIIGTPTGERAPYYLQAELYFESAEAMRSALGSADGRATAADVANFATGGATMFITEA